MEDYEDLNWQEVAVKGRSKREIYCILVVKGKYYLPLNHRQTQLTFMT